MSTNKVSLYISKILEDLDNGLTWYKKEDAGFGSIQEKYGAKEIQIQTIRKHPLLKDVEPNNTVFEVIDDVTSKDNSNATGTHQRTIKEEVIKSGAETKPGEQKTEANSDAADREGAAAFVNL